jgi:hypothetical protein
VKNYRIPCRCSATIVVGPGQAGGTVACPACGAPVAVPRLRDLDQFAQAGEVPAVHRRAGLGASGRTLLLLGLVTTVLSALTALGVTRYASALVARLPDESMIRAGVNQADTQTIYEVWKMMRRADVDRGPLPDELHAQRTTASTERIARFLWVLAAGGAVAAIAGVLLGLASGGVRGAGSQ